MSDQAPPGFDEDVLRHYQTYREVDRLSSGQGLLELLRTQELIGRYLGEAALTIVDVGGGPGAYAVWLAGLGHRVHLIDPVPEHVRQAEGAAADADVSLESLSIADGRELPLDDGIADLVLLMGPLYHLHEREDRMRALGEARRVAVAGAAVIVAAINRFAAPLDGLWSGWIDDGAFRTMIAHALETGRHTNPTGDPDYFTTSYYHHADDLRAEVEAAGLTGVTVCAVEGVGWAARDLDERLADPDRRRHLLDLLRRLETEPTLLGASPHLLAVGRVPGG